MPTPPHDNASILAALKPVITKYPHITQNEYDALKEVRPARATLYRHFGSFANACAKALEMDEGDVSPDEDSTALASRSYLVEQNSRLSRALDKQRNLTQVFVENCLAEIEKLAVRPVRIPAADEAPEELDFHSLRSDSQVGERVDSRSVQGLSVYNATLYDERVKRWTEKVALFREQDRRSLGLNKLVLNWLGDQVEGESIYPGQAFYLDLHLTEQLFHSVEVETSSILTLAAEFPRVEIYCVSGNHGRIGKKGDHSGVNFDYLFYRALKSALSRQENVKMYIAESPSMLVRHGDFHFLLNHGDNARGWNGIPYYGLERMFRRMHDLFGVRIDVELIGHHHQASNLSDRMIINGCLPGGSELSINRMGVSSRPSQKIYYFHPEHGINRETNLYLSDPVRLTADANGIYTAVV